MKRPRPDLMILWPADRQGPATWGLYYDNSKRCPRFCEDRGRRHSTYGHVVYVRAGLQSRPVPFRRQRKGAL